MSNLTRRLQKKKRGADAGLGGPATDQSLSGVTGALSVFCPSGPKSNAGKVVSGISGAGWDGGILCQWPCSGAQTLPGGAGPGWGVNGRGADVVATAAVEGSVGLRIPPASRAPTAAPATKTRT